jgi:stage II sporulation protein Q
MRRNTLKNLILPTLFITLVVASFFSISIFNGLLMGNEQNYDYSKSLMKEVTEYTLKETELEAKKFVKPYVSENVEIDTYYYNKDNDNERKEKSLIFYENTYMPSSGVIYTSSEDFDVISVYDGKVTNIKEDDILGSVVEVTHNTNLITYYYSLKDIRVNVGDEIKTGTILGRGTTNKLKTEKNNFLFEVYYQGKSLDPENFYSMNIDELQ